MAELLFKFLFHFELLQNTYLLFDNIEHLCYFASSNEKSVSRVVNMMCLPEDCHRVIISHVATPDLFKVSLVSQTLYHLIDESVFERRCKEEIPFLKEKDITWKRHCYLNIRGLYTRRLFIDKDRFLTSFQNYIVSSPLPQPGPFTFTPYPLGSSINACDYSNGRQQALIATTTNPGIYLCSSLHAHQIDHANNYFNLQGKRCITELKWFDNDTFVTGDSTGMVGYWTLNSDNAASLQSVVKTHDAFITCLQIQYSRRVRCVYSGAKDGSIQAWNVKTGNLVNIGDLKEHTSSISSLCYISRVNWLFSGAISDSFLTIFSCHKKMKKQQTITKVHKRGISDIKYAGNNILITLGKDRRIKVWNVHKKQLNCIRGIYLDFLPNELSISKLSKNSNHQVTEIDMIYVGNEKIGRLSLDLTPERNLTKTWFKISDLAVERMHL